MGLQGYGAEVGCHADLVVLQAADPVEAIRISANRLMVIRRGKVIAESKPLEARLHLEGRPSVLDFTGPWEAGVPESRAKAAE